LHSWRACHCRLAARIDSSAQQLVSSERVNPVETRFAGVVFTNSGTRRHCRRTPLLVEHPRGEQQQVVLGNARNRPAAHQPAGDGNPRHFVGRNSSGKGVIFRLTAPSVPIPCGLHEFAAEERHGRDWATLATCTASVALTLPGRCTASPQRAGPSEEGSEGWFAGDAVALHYRLVHRLREPEPKPGSWPGRADRPCQIPQT
jgi:hypothetical protein